jgi:hypothetical protein
MLSTKNFLFTKSIFRFIAVIPFFDQFLESMYIIVWNLSLPFFESSDAEKLNEPLKFLAGSLKSIISELKQV